MNEGTIQLINEYASKFGRYSLGRIITYITAGSEQEKTEILSKMRKELGELYKRENERVARRKQPFRW